MYYKIQLPGVLEDAAASKTVLQLYHASAKMSSRHFTNGCYSVLENTDKDMIRLYHTPGNLSVEHKRHNGAPQDTPLYLYS